MGSAAIAVLLSVPEGVLLVLSARDPSSGLAGGALTLASAGLVGQLSGLTLLALTALLVPGGYVRLSHAALRLLDTVAWGFASPAAGRRLVAAQLSFLPACAVCIAGWYVSVRTVLDRLHNEGLMAAAVMMSFIALLVISALAGTLLYRLFSLGFDAIRFPRAPLPVIVLLVPVLLVLSVGGAIAGYEAVVVGDLVHMSWLPQLAAVAAGAAVGSLLVHPRLLRTNQLTGWGTGALPLLLFLVLGNLNFSRLPVQVDGHLGRLTLGLASGLSDVDGDGFGSLFGGPDCAPFNSEINPAAREISGNGVDENCNGADGETGYAVDLEAARKYRTRLRKVLPEPPNIILVTWDAARAANFSCNGYRRKTTPEVDKLAAESALFSQAYAPGPNTHSSVPAILTGKNIFSVALRRAKKSRMMIIMENVNVTMAEMLQSQGYHTAAVVSHRFFDKKHNWHQGFDEYSIAVRSKRRTVSSPRILNKALKIVKKHEKTGKGPLFLWAHFYDPHSDYVKHEGTPFKVKSKNARDRYDSELWFTDVHTGKLLRAVAKLHGKTVVIISADHGDSLGEHGKAGQHRDLHGENLHVPLLVHIPGVRPVRVDEPVSLTDLLPTIADLAGAEVPEGVKGISLLSGIFTGHMDHDRPVFSEVAWRFQKPPEHWVAATQGHYRLLKEIHSGHKELYSIRTDPMEEENLVDMGLEEEAELERSLSGFLETSTVPTADSVRIP